MAVKGQDKPQKSWTVTRERKFLTVLRETCNVRQACDSSGIPRSTAYERRHKYPAFAAAWKEAEDEAVDQLEQEAWRRAFAGFDKPITYQGEITAVHREYSDRLMEMLLRAHRPEKYRENSRVEVTGADGGPIKQEMITAETTPEEAARIYRERMS